MMSFALSKVHIAIHFLCAVYDYHILCSLQCMYVILLIFKDV